MHDKTIIQKEYFVKKMVKKGKCATCKDRNKGCADNDTVKCSDYEKDNRFK